MSASSTTTLASERLNMTVVALLVFAILMALASLQSVVDIVRRERHLKKLNSNIKAAGNKD